MFLRIVETDPSESAPHPLLSLFSTMHTDAEDTVLGSNAAFLFGKTTIWDTLPEAYRHWADEGGDERHAAAECAVEAMPQRLFAAYSTGQPGRPQWTVCPAASIDGTTPGLQAELAELTGAWEAWRAAIAEGDEAAQARILGEIESPLVEFPEFEVDFSPVDLDAPWVSLPTVDLGDQTDPFVTVFDESTADVDRLTLDALLRSTSNADNRPLPTLLGAGRGALSEEAEEILHSVLRAANELLPIVLMDPPRISLRLASVADWLGNPAPLRWMIHDAPANEWVPLAEGSRAQQRWVRFAVAAAIIERATDLPHAVMLLDEPELALHATAEEHMAAGLILLAERTGATVVVATHSASVLNPPGIRLLHVHRHKARSVATELPAITSESIPALGLRRADFLLLQRTFVLVEGVHDKWLLDHLIGRELAEHRAFVMPVHGGKYMTSAVDSQLLTEFTDARILVTLDNLEGGLVRTAWDEVRLTWTAGQTDESIRLLDTVFPKPWKKSETGFLYNVFRGVLEAGRAYRMEVYPFSKRDILDYVPVELLAPKARAKGRSWRDVHDEYDKERSARSPESKKPMPPFKKWMRVRYEAPLDDDDYVRAVIMRIQAGPIDSDFSGLLDTCRTVPEHRMNA